MQNLRDKLLKAGLVTEKAAQEASKPQPKAPPAPRARGPVHHAENNRAAPPPRERVDSTSSIPKLPPLQGSKEANRLASKQQLQLNKTIHELVVKHTVPIEPGATTFYFVTRKNKLRRLELSEAQAKALESGSLCVVERPDPDKIEHALVPPTAAAELAALSDKVVRFWKKEGANVGFLSEDEIHARAHETSEPDAPDAAENAGTAAEGETPVDAATTNEGAAPATDAGVWMTIKRAPR